MNTADEHEEDQTPGWLQLVLFPFMLIEAIRQLFASRAEELKAKRRTHALPTDWQDLLDDLRHAEWPILAITAEGARRILAGEPLDLDHIPITSPALNHLWIPPTSAQQMHIRILAFNRFHADPERFIYRHAERILRREAEQGAAPPPTTTTTTTTTTKLAPPAADQAQAPAAAAATTITSTRRAGMRVRAPPWRIAIPYSPLPIPSEAKLPRPHPFVPRASLR